jgi:hypothetical protein
MPSSAIHRKDILMNRKTFFCLLSLAFAAFPQGDTVTIIEKPDSAEKEVVVPATNSVVSTTKSRDQEYTTEELQTKLAGYTRMHNAGHTLLAAGIPVTCVGIIVLSVEWLC